MADAKKAVAPAAGSVPDAVDVIYREAKAADIPAIRDLLRGPNLLVHEEAFVDKAVHAVGNKIFPGDGGQCVVTVAERVERGRSAVIGVIVVGSMNMLAARERGHALCAFDLLQTVTPETDMTVVKAVAVARPYRRQGVGTELMYTGVRAVAADPKVQVIVLCTAVNDANSAEFVDSVHFHKFGRLPGFLHPVVDAPTTSSTTAPAKVDAVLWVTPLHSNELVEYVQPANVNEEDDTTLLNLGDPDLGGKKVKRMPKWLRDFLLQFVLPFGIVFLVFVVSYILVLLGPLKGIGDADWLKGPGWRQRDFSGAHSDAAPTPAMHEFDSPDEYDEL